jgi:CRISPR-associated protein Cmr2
VTNCDHYLANAPTPVGNLLESTRNAAAVEWRPGIEAFYPQPADLTSMPDGSWLLRIDFSLRKPYTSKAEGEFRSSEGGYEIQNPIVRDHLTGLPTVRPATWKGHLTFAARLEAIEDQERLFGSASGENGEAGRLHFFPTFFEGELSREVVTPLSRVTRTPVRGPIDFEVLKAGSRGCFHLLYVPRPVPGAVADVAVDLERSAKAVGSMLLNYGFSARKTSGWGVTSDQVNGLLSAVGAVWPSSAGPEKKPLFVEPADAFLKFMNDSGAADPRVTKASGEWLSNAEFKTQGGEIGSLTEYKKFRAWYESNGEEWKRRKKGSAASGGILRQYSFGSLTELTALAGSLAVAIRKVADA